MSADDFAEEKGAIAEEFRFRGSPDEMEQRKINEPRFKIIKEIIQNVPFTISEINELTGILCGKKRRIELEEEWVKKTQGCDSETPPLPDVVLEMLFKKLPTNDILSCRSVCHGWWPAATKELRKRVSKSFSTDSPELNKFLKIMKKSHLLPITSFHLRWTYPETPELSYRIQRFFQIFGPIIQNLSLHFTLSYTRNETRADILNIQKYVGEIKLGKLLNLEITFGIEQHLSLGDDARRAFLTTFVNAAQNVKHIRFEAKKYLVELIHSLKNTSHNNMELTSLSLDCVSLTDEDLEYLGQMKLKRLSLQAYFLHCTSATMKTYLQSQSQTLEYLKLFPYNSNSNSNFEYDFPRMKNMKILSIELLRLIVDGKFSCVPFSWPETFPKIEEFETRNRIYYTWLQAIFPTGTVSVCHGLKVICLPSDFGSSMDETIPVIAKNFPNVHTVKLPIERLPYYANVVGRCFPNMKTLIFHDDAAMYEEAVVTRKIQFLTDTAWRMELNEENQEFYCQRLTSMAFEMKIPHLNADFQTVRKTYDCTWFLRLLCERVKLEKLVREQRSDNDNDTKSVPKIYFSSSDESDSMSEKNFDFESDHSDSGDNSE